MDIHRIVAIEWETITLASVMLAGLAAFAGFWCLVCMMISVLGGWGRLAKRFPRSSPPTGKRFDMASGSVGRANYNNCLTVHVGERGIDFAVWPIFRIGHKPLFIPWTELNEPEVKRFLWHKYVRIDVGSPKVATITVSEKVFAAFMGVAHPGPPVV